MNGYSHTLHFHEHFVKPTESLEAKPPMKEELRIMLKRQVLREMIYDPDFNQPQNFATFGQANIALEMKNTPTCLVPSKTQTEMIHQLLEMVVE